MNITEFAEQIVFGTSLEDKLAAPDRLVGDANRHQAPRVDSLAAPHRPKGMEMGLGKSSNQQPPADDQLENEYARGQLLHFLANHELLATELMALVLLKFPDAPPAFRRGVLVTLQEEQAHTRMYIRRMQECGVEFGRFPLSGQFWRIVEPMKSPMDFVARLSLTFEQANLDYSLHFASVFDRIGDTQTAQVLQKIYEDEIGHVQHGLQWFRQWKDPQHNDWEAYQASLEFPMSPQRGRGPRCAFNREGRRQAGLTEDFIDAIEVFRQSRGRTPTVWWFDPAAESELAGESSPRIAPLMERLGRDMELAMLAMARQDDVLLLRQLPSQNYRKTLIDAGFDLPEMIDFKQRNQLNQRKLHDLQPWAWTPQTCHIAQEFAKSMFQDSPAWRADWESLYRKSWSNDLFIGSIQREATAAYAGQPSPDWMIDMADVGHAVSHVDEIAEALKGFANQGHRYALLKQDLATSGRGQRRLDCYTGLTNEDRSWIASMTACSSENAKPTPRQWIGVIEPELDRQLDLSFLWNRLPDGQIRYLGWTRPRVTAGRRYAGTRLGTALFDCNSSLKQFVLADRCQRLQEVADWLETNLVGELTRRNFVGRFGVDAMVFHDRNQQLKIKPLVELNPRTTMGHVALGLKKRLAPGIEAEFRIFTRTQWQQLANQLNGVLTEVNSDRQLKSGVVCFSEPDAQSKLIPAFLVGRSAIHLAQHTL